MTLCVRSLVQVEQLEILIAPSLDWQTCMHGREAMLWVMYRVVQGQGRTANTFHELLKEQTWKGKMLPGPCW